MNYSEDGLFLFKKIKHGYELFDYLGAGNPNITEIKIPGWHKLRPVTQITTKCFDKCKYLRRIYIPGSIGKIEMGAFSECGELREIRLPPCIRVEAPAFLKCPKLDPKTVLKGCVGSTRVSAAFRDVAISVAWDEFLRPDVFELALKYDTFRVKGMEYVYKELIRRGLFSYFETLEQAGKSPTAEQIDALIAFSSQNRKTEITAYLLDYKNRKFGFSGGDNLEL